MRPWIWKWAIALTPWVLTACRTDVRNIWDLP